MSIKYQQEFLDDVKSEVLPLIEGHYSEVYPARDTFDLEMDWDTYYSLEGLNLLKIFTARDQGNLIGYLWVVIAPNLHSKGHFIPSEDGLYVSPEYRGLTVARRLIQFTEKCLKEDGYKIFCMTGTVEKPIDKFVERMGYNKIETRFKKVL